MMTMFIYQNTQAQKCYANFVYTKSGKSVSFYDSSYTFLANGTATKPSNYFWSFGDGTSSTQQNPTHTYSAYKAYNVYLVIQDSTRTCTDTFFQTITTKLCSADFVASTNGLDLDLKNTSSSADSMVSYTWTYGDGTSGKGKNVATHKYSKSGTYTVCLVMKSSSCGDSTCQQVYVTNGTAGGSTFGIKGFISVDANTAADEATVYLMRYNPADSMLSVMDTFSFTKKDSLGGMYYFNYIKEGIYTIKAALNSGSSYYADYVPTYTDSSLTWTNATKFNLDSTTPSFFLANVRLQEGKNPGGPGKLSGKVVQGLNKVGDPLANIQIILTDKNGKLVAFTMTDANGLYSFPSLAYGDYKLHAEVLNKKAQIMSITLSSAVSEIKDINVSVGTKSIVTTLGEDELTISNFDFSVFPNPSQNELNIRSASGYRYEVLNLQGKVLINGVHKTGEVIQTVSLSNIENGMYFMKVTPSNGVSVIKAITVSK